MGERDATTPSPASAIERKRARERARRARLIAQEPDYYTNLYLKQKTRNPDCNKEKYRRAMERDPQYNIKKRQRAKAKRIADGRPAKKRGYAPRKSTEATREYARKRYEKNRRKKIVQVVQRQKERYATDRQYALYKSLRSRMRYAVKAQSSSSAFRTVQLIDCSPKQLAAHIESQFVDGMSWSNRGQWHIDHIIPVSAFDLTTHEGQRAAFHYTNLRPLWASDNRRKGAKPPTRQRRFSFGYVVLADKQKKPGTEGRLGTERRRARGTAIGRAGQSSPPVCL